MRYLNEVRRFDMIFLSAPFLMSTEKQITALRKMLILEDKTIVFNGVPLNDLHEIYKGKQNLVKLLKALTRVVNLTKGNKFEIQTNADVYPGFAFEIYIDYFERIERDIDFKVYVLDSNKYEKLGLFKRFTGLVDKVFTYYDEFERWYYGRTNPNKQFASKVKYGLDTIKFDESLFKEFDESNNITENFMKIF